MKRKFREVSFRPESLERIQQCNEIINDYLEQGLRLTLRQLYYQLVSRNIVPNTEKSYKSVGKLVSDARLAGRMDWNAIEDRVRVPRSPSEFDNLKELVEAALDSYRLPRWNGQQSYVELWVEKDALAGVLSPLASEFHVTLMVNRGYSSQSAMYASATRFRRHADKNLVLFYLGDHDPSGEDMVRDIRDRMEMFGVHGLDVQKLALTMDQIEQHNPPPNPAKVSDPRAGKYIEQHGDESWEVDALPPEILAEIIRGAFSEVVDEDEMELVKSQEETDKLALKAAVQKIMGE